MEKTTARNTFEYASAGSICGAPKEKTVSIIREVEQEKRVTILVFLDFLMEKILTARKYPVLEKHQGEVRYRSGGGYFPQ